MSVEKNKEILKKGNAAISAGNNEGFLAFCSEEVEWTFVGDQTLQGKDAIRRYMSATYHEPPRFTVTNLIAEGDFIIALGDITLKDADAKEILHSYCDVWRFRSDKIIELKAFVVKKLL